MQVKKQQFEPDMKLWWTGSKFGKDYIKTLFNLYAEYIIKYTRLDESQGGIKIAGEISTTSYVQMIPL